MDTNFFRNIILVFLYLIMFEFLLKQTLISQNIEQIIFKNKINLTFLIICIALLSCQYKELSVILFISFGYLYLRTNHLTNNNLEEKFFNRRKKKKEKEKKEKKKLRNVPLRRRRLIRILPKL